MREAIKVNFVNDRAAVTNRKLITYIVNTWELFSYYV